MAKFLLDTCTFLWIPYDAPELSASAREAFQDPNNEIYLSAISGWEIAVKNKLGRLPLPSPPHQFIPEMRTKYHLLSLPLEESSALAIHRLPELHRDPFDRMLICQAMTHGLTLLTPDQQIHQYPILVAW